MKAIWKFVDYEIRDPEVSVEIYVRKRRKKWATEEKQRLGRKSQIIKLLQCRAKLGPQEQQK